MSLPRRGFLARVTAIFLGAATAGCEVRVRLESKPTELGARWVMADGTVVPWDGGRIDSEFCSWLGWPEFKWLGEGERPRAKWACPATGTVAHVLEGHEIPEGARIIEDPEENDGFAVALVERPFIVHMNDGSKIYSRGA